MYTVNINPAGLVFPITGVHFLSEGYGYSNKAGTKVDGHSCSLKAVNPVDPGAKPPKSDDILLIT